jgi:hypothetical protein
MAITTTTTTTETVSDEEECCICMRSMYMQKVKTTCCAHRFHKKCINTWMKNHHTCPLCRAEISSENRLMKNLEQAFEEAFINDSEMYDNLVNDRIRVSDNRDTFYLFDASEEDMDFIRHWNDLNPEYLITFE